MLDLSGHACRMLQKWTDEKEYARKKVVHWLDALNPREDGDHASQMLRHWRSRQRHADKMMKRWMGRVRRSQRAHFKSLLVSGSIAGSAELESPIKTAFEELLGPLSPEERYIVKKRFGFWDGSRSTLVQLGHVLGLTRERVRQIEEKAKNTIRRDRDRMEAAAGLLKDMESTEAALASRLVQTLRP